MFPTFLVLLGASIVSANFDCGGGTDGDICKIPPMVSVIVPTSSQRAKYHAGILACFESQTYPRRELLVLDEGSSPSAVFSGKRGVKYALMPNIPLGKKRNELIKLASGDIIAHFDDDDFYAANYLEIMVKKMEELNLSLLKLSGFYVYLSKSKILGFWDQKRDSAFLEPHLRGDAAQWPVDSASLFFSRFNGLHIKGQAFGPQPWDFGFSLMYRKVLHKRVNGFNDQLSLGEDADFTKKVLALGEPGLAMHISDTEGIALKMMHPHTSSNALSQYILPPWFLQKIFGSQVQAFADRVDRE